MSATANDDESLLAKIKVLLDTTHHDEFLLIVLVLLTRVSDDAKLQKIWTENSDVLSAYAVRLQHKPQYLHIVARLVGRLSRAAVAPKVYQVLFNELSERVETKAPLSSLDTDLILALIAIVPQDQVNHVLDNVWQRLYHVRMCTENSVEVVLNEDASFDDAMTVDSSCSQNSDWKLVNDTLDNLLTADDVMTSFHQAVLLMFITHGPQECHCSGTEIPSWYKPMVLWVTNTAADNAEPPTSILPQWHGVVFQCTRQLTLSDPNELHSTLLRSKSISSRLIQLILLYITSSSPQTDADVTSLAWTTLARMVEAFGFDWMMMPGSGSLGSATSLCTTLRLATGEWRIQLGRLCVEETLEQDAFDVVDSCGRTIVAALFHILHLAETRKEKFQMNGSALLHLRDSLQDALHATVQYLCQPRTLGDSQSLQSQAIAGRVLGSLLTEFDVWDGLPTGITTDETLKALSAALQYADDTPGALLPSLVMVLASVEDKDYCAKSLDKYHLLGKILINFLISFWKQNDGMKTSETIAACQVAELWYNLTNPPSSVTVPLRKAMFLWLRKEVVNASPNASALSSAVDCFLMLFGRSMPSEREAKVVQRALDLCD